MHTHCGTCSNFAQASAAASATAPALWNLLQLCTMEPAATAAAPAAAEVIEREGVHIDHLFLIYHRSYTFREMFKAVFAAWKLAIWTKSDAVEAMTFFMIRIGKSKANGCEADNVRARRILNREFFEEKDAEIDSM